MVDLPRLLVDEGLLDADDLGRLRQTLAHTEARAEAALVKLGLVSEADLLRVQAAATGLSVLPRASFPDPLPFDDRLNRSFLRRHAIAPIAFESGQLMLAVADASDQEAVEALAFATGTQVDRVLATFSDIEEAIGVEDFSDGLDGENLGSSGSMAEDLERLAEGASVAPVIRLVQRLLTNAVNRRASDVHIEPMARHVLVRYRIDGRLVEVERHPDSVAGPIASRIKVMAGLDIAETRLPQDGRLKLAVRGRDVDVRVSTSPIAHGESIVLRLLGRTEVPLELERLGLPPATLLRLERALARPHGIILLTGPTGSGKTTTLYAAINHLRGPDVKILTVEDPVEVILEGVNQVQVRPEINLDYAATLKAFLRQDPDILMIGEIRDQETAEIAMRAALTGHLVLSTLHTNSAIGAFTRLADIGVEPFLTASTVIATIAQRLVRQLCRECRVPSEPDARERQLFDHIGFNAPPVIYEPSGCPACSGTGYKGRLPMLELVEVDEPMREHVREGRTISMPDSRPAADTLLGHGLSLVAEGRTSMAEVERTVQLG